MKVAVLFSGGKDSCLALHKVLREKQYKKYEVSCLLNIFPENNDSFMFHKPDLALLSKQAEELGFELLIRESEGEKEKELEDLKKLIQEVKDKYKIGGIVAGGIASGYQGKRIKEICDSLELEFISPLWNYTPERVWEELFDLDFEIILVKISCDGLGKEWLGKKIGKNEFGELKNLSERYGFRIDFEGGEAETAVLFMPGFRKHIKIKYSIKSEGEHRHWMEIREVRA